MKIKCISEEKRCVTHVLKWSIYIVSNNFESCLNVRVYETVFFCLEKQEIFSQWILQCFQKYSKRYDHYYILRIKLAVYFLYSRRNLSDHP